MTTAAGAEGTAAAVCAAVTVGSRMVAVTYGWTLPTAQTLGVARENR